MMTTTRRTQPPAGANQSEHTRAVPTRARKDLWQAAAMTVAMTVLMSGQARAQSAAVALVPADPEALLAVLPAAPEGWQLEQSNARTTLAEPGYEVVAIRRYRRVDGIEEPATTARQEGQGPVLVIRLRDRARTDPLPFVFARLTEALDPDDQSTADSPRWHGHPMILTEPQEDAEAGGATPDFRLRVLIGRRFVLEAEGWQLAWDDAGEWLDQVDHRRLARVESRPLAATAERLARLRRVDELDPQRHHAYEVVRGDPAAIEADNRAAGHVPGITGCEPD